MEILSGYCIKPEVGFGRKRKDSEIVGIEIELELVKKQKYVANWHTVTDHSLKLNGNEYTLCTYSHEVERAVAQLFDCVKAVPTSRTSVHVHLNVQDLPYDNFKTLIALYYIFEKALYEFSGYRWNNIFCVPLNEFMLNTPIFIADSYKYVLEKYQPDSYKYAGLNFARLPDLGTIEFRQMKGNINPKYIQTWVDIIVCLKKYAKDTPFEQFKDLILTMNNNSAYWWLIDMVFGKYTHALNYAEYAADVEESISNLKHLVFSLNIKNAYATYSSKFKQLKGT